MTDKLRGELRAKLRARWQLIAGLVAIWLLAAATIVGSQRVFGGPPVVTAFVLGVLVGVLPWFWSMIQTAFGFSHRMMGGEAERWTADELAKLNARTWRILHDVPLIRSGNVDHVAIGPGRVYAVETKWTAADSRYLDHAIDNWAGQADRRAQALARLLRARDVDRQVIALLVVWGPGVAEHLGDTPVQRGNTRVVAGRHSDKWLARMTQAAALGEVDHSAYRVLENHVASTT